MGLTDRLPGGGNEYPVEITLIKKRKHGYTITQDRAKRVEEDEKGEIYELKKSGEKTRPIPYDQIERKTKYSRFKGKHKVDFLSLYVPDKGRFIPIDFDSINEDGELSELASDEKEWQNWRERMMPDIVNAYDEKSFWQLYYPHILMVVLTMSIILSIGAAIKFQGDMATQLGSVADRLGEVAQRLEQINTQSSAGG